MEKPVPRLEPVISRIMNVIWIDEKVEKMDKSRVRINVRVANYTMHPHNFTLYGDYPLGNVVETDGIEEEDYIRWNVAIEPVSYRHFYFVLEDASGYGETNYYVDGVNPGIVVGAEPLPGDWNIRLDFIEEEESEEEPQEEEIEGEEVNGDE